MNCCFVNQYTLVWQLITWSADKLQYKLNCKINCSFKWHWYVDWHKYLLLRHTLSILQSILEVINCVGQFVQIGLSNTLTVVQTLMIIWEMHQSDWETKTVLCLKAQPLWSLICIVHSAKQILVSDLTWMWFFLLQSSYKQVDGYNEHGWHRAKESLWQNTAQPSYNR